MDSSLVLTLKATIQCTGTANSVNLANSKQEVHGVIYLLCWPQLYTRKPPSAQHFSLWGPNLQ